MEGEELMNTVNLIGNLGQDPEMKYFDSGTVVCSFSIALASYDKKEQKETTDWVLCKSWGKTAEVVGEYVKKGHKLGVCGSLKTDTWEKDGKKQSKTYVLVSRVDLLTSKKDGEPGERQTHTKQNNNGNDESLVQFGDELIGEDEIPF